MKEMIPTQWKSVQDGEVVYDLASDTANDDWIRAARLLQEEKKDEVEEMEDKQMEKAVNAG